MSAQTATADEVALLHDLVAIPSVNPGERQAVTYLCEQMARRGFLTDIDGIGNAIGSIGDGRFHVVMLGHIDTVPGQFPVRIEGDDLYGRGSVDAKGPLATFVAATARAYERGLLDGLRVTVIGGIGEEAHSPGANFLAETMPAPDACIIGEPGNWESVVLGYKGSMQLRYDIEQPNAHGAGQQAPAPQVAVGAWNSIVLLCAPYNEGVIGAFDRVEPTLRGFSSESDGLVQRARLDMNVRLPPSLNPEALWDRLATEVQAGQLSLLESPVPAYRCEKNTPLVRSLLAGVRAAGGTPRFKVKTGTADMNVVGPVWRCQMAAYGPGDSSLDHTPTEHISLTEYGRAIASLANALGELAAQTRGRGCMSAKVGLLLSQVRVEEKNILARAAERGIAVERVFDREVHFDLSRRAFPDVDVVLDRSLVHSRAEYTLRLLSSWGIPTVNSFSASQICDNKFQTTLAFVEAGVPTLRTMVAYTPQSALDAIEEMGYPAVLKPNTGSWGRLLAKVNTRAAAEAVLEHKAVLGSFHHSIFYIQEYIHKPGRDIRVFVVGDRAIAASYRNAEHWVTNTARGATSTHAPITPEIEQISLDAARAVGGEIMGVDLVETDTGLKVIEINVGAEFHGLMETTEVDIAGEILDYVVSKARQGGGAPTPVTAQRGTT